MNETEAEDLGHAIARAVFGLGGMAMAAVGAYTLAGKAGVLIVLGAYFVVWTATNK